MLFIVLLIRTWDFEENVEGTVDNRTDSVLLFYFSYPEWVSAGLYPGEVKPHTKGDFFAECGDGSGAERIRMTASLSVKEGGRLLYRRTEECGVWQRSNRKFIIEQRNGEFVVTDPIAATTPRP